MEISSSEVVSVSVAGRVSLGPGARCAEPFAAPPGQQQDVGIDLIAVFVRERLHRRRVIGLDGGLQLRQVGDEAAPAG